MACGKDSKNKAKQTQFKNRSQKTDDGRQTTEDRRQKPALLALRSLIVSGEAGSTAEWVRNDRPNNPNVEITTSATGKEAMLAFNYHTETDTTVNGVQSLGDLCFVARPGFQT